MSNLASQGGTIKTETIELELVPLRESARNIALEVVEQPTNSKPLCELRRAWRGSSKEEHRIFVKWAEGEARKKAEKAEFLAMLHQIVAEEEAGK